MATFTISMDDELSKAVEKTMKKKRFSNRSEYFRALARKDCFFEERENNIGIEKLERALQNRDKRNDMTFKEFCSEVQS